MCEYWHSYGVATSSRALTNCTAASCYDASIRYISVNNPGELLDLDEEGSYWANVEHWE
jgi:hypothetical protein